MEDKEKKVYINSNRRQYWLENAFLFWILKMKSNRNPNLWVFGAWEGNRYDDNSRYLFEYVNKYHKEIDAVWLSNNKQIVKLVRTYGYKSFDSKSKEGRKIQLSAGVYFYTNGIDDIGNVSYIYGALIIGLWHGTGMKNVYYQMPNVKQKSIRNTLKWIKDKIYNSVYQDYAIATSDTAAEMRAATYRLNKSQMLITGQPRNDVFKKVIEKNLVLTNLTDAKEYKYIIYMPTYRPYESNLIENFVLEIANDKEFVEFLRINKIRFLLKLHYLTKIRKSMVSDPFFVISNDDISSTQELVAISDYMVTDYSGCCIDFALLKRPIFFYVPDYEKYSKEVGLKTEWTKIYSKYGIRTIPEFISNFKSLFNGKYDDLCDVYQVINSIYENPQIAETCYSENVYRAVKSLINVKQERKESK